MSEKQERTAYRTLAIAPGDYEKLEQLCRETQGAPKLNGMVGWLIDQEIARREARRGKDD